MRNFDMKIHEKVNTRMAWKNLPRAFIPTDFSILVGNAYQTRTACQGDPRLYLQSSPTSPHYQRGVKGVVSLFVNI